MNLMGFCKSLRDIMDAVDLICMRDFMRFKEFIGFNTPHGFDESDTFNKTARF